MPVPANQARDERSYRRGIEDIIHEQAKARRIRAQAASSSSARPQEDGDGAAPPRQRRRPEPAAGKSASTAARNNPRSDRTVRFRDDDQVIRLPDGDGGRSNITRHVDSAIQSQVSGARDANENNNGTQSPSSALESYRNECRVTDSWFVAAGAVVLDSFSWSKNETHNHFYNGSGHRQQTQSQPGATADSHRSTSSHHRLPLGLQVSYRPKKWLAVCLVVIVVIVVLLVCHSVFRAYVLAKDVISWPLVQALRLGSTGAAMVGWATGRSKPEMVAKPVVGLDDTQREPQQQNVAPAVSPLIPQLGPMIGVVNQVDQVARDIAAILPGSPATGMTEISSTLRELRVIQDETNTVWVREMKGSVYTARRLSTKLRGLQAEVIGAEAWWGRLGLGCGSLKGLLCSNLRTRVVAELVQVEGLVASVHKALGMYVENGALLTSAHVASESVCRLHEGNAVGGVLAAVREVATISGESDQVYPGGGGGGGGGQGDGDTTDLSKAEKLRQAKTRIRDQCSGLRVNCIVARRTPAETEVVQLKLADAMENMAGVWSSLLWMRGLVEGREQELKQGVTMGLEALRAVEQVPRGSGGG